MKEPASNFTLNSLWQATSSFLEYEIITLGKIELRVYSILTILLIFVSTKFIIWVIKKALKARFKKLNEGNIYALYQITRYILWVIAIALMLEAVGLRVTLLLAGSAALLVGVGLGLQQTFNDFISGIILLTEGSTKIGDVMEIDGEVVMIQSIGLRTSTALTRDEISVIIPNSYVTSNKLINWSHQSNNTRFSIYVGVAYGSDTQLVTRLLKESAAEHPEVGDHSKILVHFRDFGNSSLDFRLLFFSDNVFRIERIKSEIRYTIDRKFRENKVTIPFPQVDVHIKS